TWRIGCSFACSAVTDPPDPAHEVVNCTQNSARFHQHNQDQQPTVEEQMGLGKTGDNFFFNDADHTAAYHATPNRAQSSDDGHQQDLNAGRETKYSVGVNEGSIAGEHAAGHAGKSGGDSVRFQLVHERIDAAIGGCVFVLVDRQQPESELVIGNPVGDGDCNRGQHQRRVVMRGLAEGGQLPDT